MLRYDVLTFRAGGSVWLKKWAEVNGEKGKNPNVGKYIGVYFGFGIGSAALVVVQTLILWIFCSIEVSRVDVLGVMQMQSRLLSCLCITGIEETSRENGFCYF